MENHALGLSSSEKSQSVVTTYRLHTAIRMAVAQVVADTRGYTAQSLMVSENVSEAQADESEVALAVAYATLMVEDPEDVTSRHLKMLRSKFSIEQIKELNDLIRQLSA